MRTTYSARSIIVWCTTNISLRSYSPLPMRSNSLSRKPIVEKLQQVLLRCWFFTGVIPTLSTVVNTKPSGTESEATTALSCCACNGSVSAQAQRMVKRVFFCIVLVCLVSKKRSPPQYANFAAKILIFFGICKFCSENNEKTEIGCGNAADSPCNGSGILLSSPYNHPTITQESPKNHLRLSACGFGGCRGKT